MEWINRMRKDKKGFTLVEIIVVLVILAILAAFTIPTMLGFVSDAKGKALIAEAREVYVAAQATATEYAGKTTPATGSDLSSSGIKAATQTDASKQMSTYLKDDIKISSAAAKANLPVSGEAASDYSFWTVTMDTTNTTKVASVEYIKNGYTITIDKNGSQVVKN